MASPSRRTARRAPALPKLWEVRDPTPHELVRADNAVIGTGPGSRKRPTLTHYGATADGRQVRTRSNRSLGAVLSTLDAMAGARTTTLRIAGSQAVRNVRDEPREAPWGPTPGERHLSVFMPPLVESHHEDLVIDESTGTALYRDQPVDLGPRLIDRARMFLALIAQQQRSRCELINTAMTLRIFVELVGNLHVAELTHEHCDRFVLAIGKWPANATKRKLFRDLPVHLVLKTAVETGTPPLHLRTQQKHLDRVRSFFVFLEARHEAQPGLMKGTRVFSKKNRFEKSKFSFTDAHLRTIFSAHNQAHFRTPFQYWAPILGLYQGMRINEIGQLHTTDIFEEGGRWVVRVADAEPQQRIKTEYSRRLLPIRPEVIACGFIDFVEQAKSWGRQTLFPDVIWGPCGPGDTIGRWFNRVFLRGTCAISDSRRTFHSLRHSFCRFARDSKLSSDEQAMLMGHSTGDTALILHYYDEVTPKPAVVAAMDRIEFAPMDHTTYDPDKFDTAFRRARDREEAMKRRPMRGRKTKDMCLP